MVVSEVNFFKNFKKTSFNSLNYNSQIKINSLSNQEIEKSQEIEKIENQNTNKKNNIWKIIIPKIGLDAEIKEGTSQKIMRVAIGHFEKSSMFEGNVALAAHNRGNKYNYFQNLKNMKIGDEIIYIKQNKKRTYKVETIEKIKENDWTYIKPTIENKITLITCIENMPEYRLCVQGIEKLEGDI